MGWTARLVTQAFDAGREYADFCQSVGEAGAIVSFAGVARSTASGGETVTSLFLDHHPRMTSASLKDIARDAGQKFEVGSVRVVHRCGRIAPGETIVFVATAAVHRRAAFEAAEYAMDRLKTEAVLWKREDSLDGAQWVEPTAADHVDRARWDR